ncbi:MAG TPA: hypothetical protein RMH85_10720 [Polyangiaceae bacterium LLY-WYZ-15_(1-7)]|nr:hypothetical protein [Myxococcales bacterium]MAT25451.1 hypothetical protein [Sandaracinus sp.]MBJ73924.1 hypothetical protein [Sandaracinus sp.]HJL00683.1 hypothetical protein [Polyangiaceae bacterium LLY-WYZ-15_(1-7)]HJL08965.1 hypothetical protein [Polyangiaceae bacterium LLY-WYZ-15_(1-7)]
MTWALALLAPGALWLFAGSDASGEAGAGAPSSGAARLHAEGALEGGRVAAAGAARSGEEDRRAGPTPEVRQVVEAPLIRAVRFEPAEPCPGEPVRVYTELRADAGDAKVFVDGQPGSPQVVVAEAPGRQRVRVLARGWSDVYERRDATLPVRACTDAPPRLRARVEATLLGERRYAFRLTPAPEGEVRWDFGDGESGESAAGQGVTHRYLARPERSHSTYLVRASYAGPSGPEESFVSVSHAEATGIAARTAYPVVESEGERFVGWDAEAGLRTHRFVTNAMDEDVEFEVASVRAFPCDGSAAEEVQLAAREVLDLTQIRAGESVDVGVRVPATPFEKPICQMHVELAGPAGARLATSGFALDTGVPDERMPVEDRATLEALRALAAEHGGGPIPAEEVAAYRATLAEGSGS